MSVESPAGVQSEPWELGEDIGHYSLLGRLAEGGMAEIWLARQSGIAGFQRVVVIKKISDAFSDDPQFVAMFLDEARIAAQLSHPNIVQVYDLGEHQGAYYITMEYLHGEDLGMLIRKSVKAGKPLPIVQAVRIIANAADGLAYAHDKAGLDGKPLNIVHRDISPQNVVVTYDGSVKILDFGIAKARSRSHKTMDGSIKGKVSYLSPEQARGEPLDCRSDVFSMGIVLYEALGRCRLFDHEDIHRNLLSIAGDAVIPPPSTLNPEIPPELDAICMRALAKPLELRLASARHLQVALEDWLRKRSDAPGTFEISGTMRSLFGDRIAYRTKMLETAQRAGPAPTFQGALLTEREVPATLVQETVVPEEPKAPPKAAAPPAPMPSGRVVAALPTVILSSAPEKPAAPAARAADPEESVMTQAKLAPAPAPTQLVQAGHGRTEMPAVHRGDTNEQAKVRTDMHLGLTFRRYRYWIALALAAVAALSIGGYLLLRS